MIWLLLTLHLVSGFDLTVDTGDYVEFSVNASLNDTVTLINEESTFSCPIGHECPGIYFRKGDIGHIVGWDAPSTTGNYSVFLEEEEIGSIYVEGKVKSVLKRGGVVFQIIGATLGVFLLFGIFMYIVFVRRHG